MNRKISVIIITVIILLSYSCKSRELETQDDPEFTEHRRVTMLQTPDGAYIPESPPQDLPVNLIIDGRTVGKDLQATVIPGQPTSIDIIASEILPGRLSIIHPDDEMMVLGEWQSEVVNFIHEFPPGESHVILMYGESVYDVIVTTESAEPGFTGDGCVDAFIEFNPDVRMEYRETAENVNPTRWEYSVTDWSRDDDGNPVFSLAIERTSGVEGNVDRSGTINLTCVDGIIYIMEVVEEESEYVWTTTYIENTIYLPPEITPGTAWVRQGILNIRTSIETRDYEIIESLVCSGEELVSTEAGDFNTLRVDYTIARSSQIESLDHEGTWWLVPGIGRILSIGEMESSPRLELISYEGVSTKN